MGGLAADPRTGRPRIPASDIRRASRPGFRHRQGPARGQPGKAVPGQIERGGETTGAQDRLICAARLFQLRPQAGRTDPALGTLQASGQSEL